ncbi:MAG: hypothetical protein LBH80_01400, partial [Prevotellaceae bacterium]|nr:hypothetical protein [Prevotellaceae bacterium]
PTLSEIVLSGVEGAKGGAFMGAILGGGSGLVNNYAQNRRRREQGSVTLADTGSEVVEVLGVADAKGDRLSVLGKDGAIRDIDRGDVKETHTVGWQEFRDFAQDFRKESLEGDLLANLTASEKRILKAGFDRSSRLFDAAFAKSDLLGSKEAILQLSPEDQQELILDMMETKTLTDYQKTVMTDYLLKGNLYNSYEKAFEEVVAKAQDDAAEGVERLVNTSMDAVVTAKLIGEDEPVYILSGAVVQNEDGSINYEESESRVFYRDKAGEMRVVSTGNISDIVGVVPREEAVTNAQSLTRDVLTQEKDNDEAAVYEPGDRVRFDSGFGVTEGVVLGRDERTGLYTVETGVGRMQVQPIHLRSLSEDDNSVEKETPPNSKTTDTAISEKPGEDDTALSSDKVSEDKGGENNLNAQQFSEEVEPVDETLLGEENPFDENHKGKRQKGYKKNGVNFAVYEDENGVPNIIIAAVGDNDFIAYMRVYDKNGNPVNSFTSKMEIRNPKKGLTSFMLSELQTLLPANHTLTENKNISLDGLKFWLTQTSHGYEYVKDEDGNIETVGLPLSNASRVNELPIEVDMSDPNFVDIRPTQAEFNKVKDFLAPIFEKEGISPDLIEFKAGNIYVPVPTLRRVRPQSVQEESFSYYKGDMGNLIEEAKNNGRKLVKRVIAPVSPELVEDLHKAGINVDENYVHTIDNFSVAHSLKQHGNKNREESRGQIALSDSDFELIPHIIESYESIEFDKNKRGQDIIKYSKTFEDGITYYVEEVRVGRKELSMTTMYKRKLTGEPMPENSSEALTSKTAPDLISDDKDSANDSKTQQLSEEDFAPRKDNGLTARERGGMSFVNDLPIRPSLETRGSARDFVESDDRGIPFVKASDGSTVFGVIDEEQAAAMGTNVAAPVKLSEGNGQYGEEHIGHRIEQLRQNGYSSVKEFVEDVSKNYDEVRAGNLYIDENGNAQETFLLVKIGEKGSVLFIELSPSSGYYEVNSGGVFNNKYIRKKELLWFGGTHRTQLSGETADVSIGQSKINPSESPGAPLSQSKLLSEGKGNETDLNVQQPSDGVVSDEREDDLKNDSEKVTATGSVT